MPINVLLAKKNVRLARKKAKKMGSPEVALFFLELITVNGFGYGFVAEWFGRTIPP